MIDRILQIWYGYSLRSYNILYWPKHPFIENLKYFARSGYTEKSLHFKSNMFTKGSLGQSGCWKYFFRPIKIRSVLKRDKTTQPGQSTDRARPWKTGRLLFKRDLLRFRTASLSPWETLRNICNSPKWRQEDSCVKFRQCQKLATKLNPWSF